MLSSLEAGFEKFGIDFYLVGATARDVWISGIHLQNPGRATKDVDLAILVNNKEQFEDLKNYLVSKHNFQQVKENAFVLIYENIHQVDLLPFGAIEDHEGKVRVDGTGYTTIDVPGFTEIFESGLPELELDNGRRFKFSTLPGITILKLFAWQDRPENRSKDIMDICEILHHYFSINDEEIWDKHSDLFTEDAELLAISARVLGRQMREILIRNKALMQRIEDLLERNTSGIENSQLGILMAQYFNNSVNDNLVLLKEISKGISEQV